MFQSQHWTLGRCEMFLWLKWPEVPWESSVEDLIGCDFYSAAAWDIPQANWRSDDEFASITGINAEYVVGPKTGCRRPDWAL